MVVVTAEDPDRRDPGVMTKADEQRIANAQLLAATVRRHAARAAYIHAGGSNGCAKCGGRSFLERLADGHTDCARQLVVWETSHSLAREIAAEVWIPIYRQLQDPRMETP